MDSRHLSTLASVFHRLTDPRHKRGIRHPFAGMLALVFLGTLAGLTEIAIIRRWPKRHWKTLQVPLGFNRKTPAETTISRTLAAFSISEFQAVFAEFLNVLLAEDHDSLVAAVDGCEPHGQLAPSREYTAVAALASTSAPHAQHLRSRRQGQSRPVFCSR